MVEPPPPPPQAPPTPWVMWGPLPWVAAGGWTKPQCAGPRARGTTAACWGRAGRAPPEVGARAPPRHGQARGAGPGAEGTLSRGAEPRVLVPALPRLPCGPGQSPWLLWPRFSSRNVLGLGSHCCGSWVLQILLETRKVTSLLPPSPCRILPANQPPSPFTQPSVSPSIHPPTLPSLPPIYFDLYVDGAIWVSSAGTRHICP